MQDRKIVGIILSTHTSSVMPGKSETVIMGLTVLEHIVRRLGRVPTIDSICLATTNETYDNNLANLAQEIGINVYRGATNDLISRLHGAAQKTDASHILKIMGNYPLIDPEMTSTLIQEHITGGYEYSFNECSKGILYGMGCEMVNEHVLTKLDEMKNLSTNQRESGLLCLLQNKQWFKTLEFKYDKYRTNYKVCLQNESDLMLINDIFTSIRVPRIESVIEFLDKHPLIAKSNCLESTKEIGLEKLYLFPEKLDSILNKTNGNPDLSYPISVELSLTNRCNLDCIWCSDRTLRTRAPGDLNINVFKSVVDDLKNGGTKGIVIEGGGEPLLYDRFNEAIEYVSEVGLSCGLITNGTKEIDREILKHLEWIRVSLDASNENEFKNIKKSSLFETIMKNISSYVEHCPVVGVGYVVTNQNCASLEPLILRLKKTGISYIQFRPVIDHPEHSSDLNLQYLLRYSSIPKFNIIIDGMKENRVNGNNTYRCKSHSLTSIITADGGVYLCGRLNKYSWFEPIGNIYEQSFSEIWYGETRREQAKTVLNREFCTKYCPECRLTKFNVLLERIERIKTKDFI